LARLETAVLNGRAALTPRGEATRIKLLAMAEDVFGDLGFDRASVSEITRRAGVAQGTFYLYFPSKRSVFSELVRQISRDVRYEIQLAIAGAKTRLDAERKGFEAFFNYVRKHPDIYRIVRQAEFVDREAFAYYYESIAQAYAAGLSTAARAGEIKKLNPEVVAWCLMGMGDLLGIRYILLGKEGKVPTKVLDTMMELVTRGIGPEGNV